MAFGASLTWMLGADTAKFQEGVGAAQAKVTAFKSALGQIGLGLGFGAVVGYFNELRQELDALGKSAKVLGVTSDYLQEMRYQAGENGVAVEQMDKSLQKLAKGLSAAANGTGALLPWLEAYNISAVDAEGNTRKVGDVMLDLADVTAGMTNATDRLAFATSVFGEEGAKMVNVLAQGREGMEAMSRRAHELGQVIEAETIDRFERFNDQLSVLSNSLKTFAANVGGWFLGLGEKIGYLAGGIVYGFEDAGKAILDAEQSSKALKEGLEGVGEAATKSTEDAIASLKDLAAEYTTLSWLDQTRLASAETLAKLQKAKADATSAEIPLEQKLTELLERKEFLEERMLWTHSEREVGARLEIELLEVQKEIQETQNKLASEKEARQKGILKLQDELKKTLIETGKLVISDQQRLNELQEREAQLKQIVASTNAETEAHLKAQIELARVSHDITQLRAEAASRVANAEREVVAELKEQVHQKMLLSQVDGPSSRELHGMTDDQLKYAIRQLEGQISRTQGDWQHARGIHGPKNFIGSGQLKLELDRLRAEEQQRDQFRRTVGTFGTEGARNFYDPFTFERLLDAYQPTEGTAKTNKLLERLNDNIEDAFGIRR